MEFINSTGWAFFRPRGGANAVAGCWPASQSNLPHGGFSGASSQTAKCVYGLTFSLACASRDGDFPDIVAVVPLHAPCVMAEVVMSISYEYPTILEVFLVPSGRGPR